MALNKRERYIDYFGNDGAGENGRVKNPTAAGIVHGDIDSTFR
jgi:hypothetical protein